MASNNSALVLPTQPTAVSGTNAVDIRGIKDPIYIPNTYAWVGWVLLGIAVAVAAWLLWKKFRRKKSITKPAVVIPPHRRAKNRLRNANELLSDPYAYCSLISDVVRTYLEERFELHAPDRTTEEFLNDMRTTAALRPDHKGLLEEFLSQCDLVKFARFEPTHDELKSLLNSALRFIDETAPSEMEQFNPAQAPAA